MATLLDVPNDERLPHITNPLWYSDWVKYLGNMGLRIGNDKEAVWREGYWIASVPSKNFKNTFHSIVMKNNSVYFDPSIHKRYRTGTLLLSKKIVKYGYWLEVSDITRLKSFLTP